MGCIKRNLIAATLMLFLVAPAISSISHAQNTVPIAGAMVSVEGSGSGFVTTDSNGKYVITEGLGTSICSIVVTAPGYIDANLGNVRVTAGQETPNINFFLKRSGAISGELNITPWSPESVTCDCSCKYPYIVMLQRPAFITVTKTAGTGGNPHSIPRYPNATSYSIYTGLSTGTYKVTAEKDGYVPYTVSNVMVTEAQETPNVNITLKPGGLMSGTVTTSAGMPLFRALVTAHSPKYSGAAYTDSDGYYKITRGLGEGTYNVFVEYQTYSSSRSKVGVRPESETFSVTLKVDIPPSGSIVGMLTDGKGNVIKDAMVRITGSAGQVEARTDEGGCYSVLLGAGDYTISASATGFYSSSPTRATVSVNQQTQINFDLKRVSGLDSGRISGQVTGEANPIPEFQVGGIPIIYALAILVPLLATRKIRSVKRQLGSPNSTHLNKDCRYHKRV